MRDGVRRRHADRKRRRARSRARRCWLDRVTLVGRVDRDELPNYYGAADVFVSGSHYEGSGYALIEAMSAGVVPVVTDIPSFRAIAGDTARAMDAGRRGRLRPRCLLEVCSTDLDAGRKRGEGAIRSGAELGGDRRTHRRRIPQRSHGHEDRDRRPGRPAPERAGTGRAVVAGALRAAGAVARHPRVRAEASRAAAKLFASRFHRPRSWPAVGAVRPHAVGAGARARARARRARSLRSDPRLLRRPGRPAGGARRTAAGDSQRRRPATAASSSSIPTIEYGSQRTRRGRRAVTEACTLASKVHVCTSFMAALAAAQGVTAAVIPLTSVTFERRRRSSGQDHAATSDTFRIVQVASLSRVKNQRLLIDALPIVRAKIDAHVDLVGEDTLNGELQKHAADDRCRRSRDVPRLPAAARACSTSCRAPISTCRSSLHEAAGVSVLEAAAAGVPALGTRAATWPTGRRRRRWRVGDAIPESLADGILALARECRSPAIDCRAGAQRSRSRTTPRGRAAQFDQAVPGACVALRPVRRQRQVQAADASPAGLIALDAERLPEGDRRRRIQRFFKTRCRGTVSGMKETRAHVAVRLEHRRYPRRVALHRREFGRDPTAPGSTAGFDRATRGRRRRSRCEPDRATVDTACSIDASRPADRPAPTVTSAIRSALHGSGRLNADDERSAARNEISSNPMRCAAAMV